MKPYILWIHYPPHSNYQPQNMTDLADEVTRIYNLKECITCPNTGNLIHCGTESQEQQERDIHCAAGEVQDKTDCFADQ